MTEPDETGRLLERFAAEAGEAVPLTALWAHGSLALGDYQPGRSDLDLIALVEAAPAPGPQDGLRRVHQALHDQVPLAEKLHCTYVARGEWADAGQDHLTWAHGEMFARPVTPVTRRELHLASLGGGSAGLGLAIATAQAGSAVVLAGRSAERCTFVALSTPRSRCAAGRSRKNWPGPRCCSPTRSRRS